MQDPLVDPHGLSFSPEELEFIEAVGLHFDTLGLPRIGGRIFGLLVISPRPLLLDEIAGTLNISRASVSVNTRVFIANGAMEIRAVPGDRRQYYAMKRDVFFSRLPYIRRHIQSMRELFTQAQAAVAEGERHRSPAGVMFVSEPPPIWGGTLRPSDAPSTRVVQGLLFLGFLESQIDTMEAMFKQRFGEKP
jgi:DNA-binding transcriptional regulator GbsR (MarR family)